MFNFDKVALQLYIKITEGMRVLLKTYWISLANPSNRIPLGDYFYVFFICVYF